MTIGSLRDDGKLLVAGGWDGLVRIFRWPKVSAMMMHEESSFHFGIILSTCERADHAADDAASGAACASWRDCVTLVHALPRGAAPDVIVQRGACCRVGHLRNRQMMQRGVVGRRAVVDY